ncbi:hypothetical protein [Nocardia terpenica]|uniref:hypothetical protein n=1 Tax=Nocardia terpenica TaxID=455432 RepID=UPI0012FD1595|nr:hypothetical protein [Nocardia terpenica]
MMKTMTASTQDASVEDLIAGYDFYVSATEFVDSASPARAITASGNPYTTSFCCSAQCC